MLREFFFKSDIPELVGEPRIVSEVTLSHRIWVTDRGTGRAETAAKELGPNPVEPLKRYLVAADQGGYRTPENKKIRLEVSIIVKFAPPSGIATDKCVSARAVTSFNCVPSLRMEGDVLVFDPWIWTKDLDTRRLTKEDFLQVYRLKPGDEAGMRYRFALLNKGTDKECLTNGSAEVTRSYFCYHSKYKRALRDLIEQHAWPIFVEQIEGRFGEELFDRNGSVDPDENPHSVDTVGRTVTFSSQIVEEAEKLIIQNALDDAEKRPGEKGVEYAFVRVGDLVTNGVVTYYMKRPEGREWNDVSYFSAMSEAAWEWLLDTIQGLFLADVITRYRGFNDKRYTAMKRENSPQREAQKKRAAAFKAGISCWDGGVLAEEILLGDAVIFPVRLTSGEMRYVVDNLDDEGIGAAYIFGDLERAKLLASGKLPRMHARKEGAPFVIHVAKSPEELTAKIVEILEKPLPPYRIIPLFGAAA